MTEHKYDKWETCYEKLNLNSKPVADCLSSGHGNEVCPFSLCSLLVLPQVLVADCFLALEHSVTVSMIPFCNCIV